MTVTRLVAACTFAITSLACSGGGITGPPPGLPHAAARPGCGPADGPAIQIVLASEPVGTSEPTTPYVSIHIWESLAQLSDRVFFVAGDNSAGGASYRASPTEFELATGGRVRITSVSADNTIEGLANLTFQGGRRVRGSFRAAWIHATPLCI